MKRLLQGLMLALVGLIISLPIQTANASYDVKYVVTRQWNEDAQRYCTTYQNWYEEDEFGDPIYNYALPINVGSDPDWTDVVWLDPGFQLTICSPEVPGDPPTVHPIDPIIGPGGNPNAGGGGGGGGGQVVIYYRFRVNKSKTHDLEIKPNTGNWKMQQVRPGGGGAMVPVPAAGGVIPGTAGKCYKFFGPKGEQLKVKSCDLTFEGPDVDTDATGIFYSMGVWPGDDTPPSFYTDPDYSFVFIGDPSGADVPLGGGVGQVVCETNIDDFMSVATPEAYTGCPEPTTFALSAIGSLFVLVRRRAR